jgi:FtsZ-binding cell division protein ZapB
LEQKLDTSLEEIALLQSELDELKTHSQEQIERLKQQLEETTTELQVKERDLKKLKFQLMLTETTQAPMQHYQ